MPIPVFALAIAGWFGVVGYVLALGRVAARADTFAGGHAASRVRAPIPKRGGAIRTMPL